MSRLRAAVEARDAENSALRAGLEKVLARLDAALAEAAAERQLRERLELKVAELDRRLSMDSTDSGTPSSKERIRAREARRARQLRQRYNEAAAFGIIHNRLRDWHEGNHPGYARQLAARLQGAGLLLAGRAYAGDRLSTATG